MSDEHTGNLTGSFGDKGTNVNQIAYGHPYADSIIEGAKEVLKESETGQTLIQVHEKYDFPIHVIKGTGESGYSPQTKVIYLQIPGKISKTDAKDIIKLAKALREAEHEVIGFTAPDPSKDFIKYASVMHAKNLDSIVFTCKVVKELTNSSYFSDLLDALTYFGYIDAYKAYENNASEKELFDAYEGR